MPLFSDYDPLLLSLILDRTLRKASTMPFHDVAGIVGCLARMQLLDPRKGQSGGGNLRRSVRTSPACSPLALDPLDYFFGSGGQASLSSFLNRYEGCPVRDLLGLCPTVQLDTQTERARLPERIGMGNALKEPSSEKFSASGEVALASSVGVTTSSSGGATRITTRLEEEGKANKRKTEIAEIARETVQTVAGTAYTAGPAGSESLGEDVVALGKTGHAGFARETAAKTVPVPAEAANLAKASESSFPYQCTNHCFFRSSSTSLRPWKFVPFHLKCQAADDVRLGPTRSPTSPAVADDSLRRTGSISARESRMSSSVRGGIDEFDRGARFQREAWVLSRSSLLWASLHWMTSLIAAEEAPVSRNKEIDCRCSQSGGRDLDAATASAVPTRLEQSVETSPTEGREDASLRVDESGGYGLGPERSSQAGVVVDTQRRGVLEREGWKWMALEELLRWQAKGSNHSSSDRAWSNERHEQGQGSTAEGMSPARLVDPRRAGTDPEFIRDRIYQRLSRQARDVVRLAAQRLPSALLDGEATGQDIGLLW